MPSKHRPTMTEIPLEDDHQEAVDCYVICRLGFCHLESSHRGSRWKGCWGCAELLETGGLRPVGLFACGMGCLLVIASNLKWLDLWCLLIGWTVMERGVLVDVVL